MSKVTYAYEPCEECGVFFNHECWGQDYGRGICPHCGYPSTFDYTDEEEVIYE